jgi:hypothetical protein
VHRLFGCLPRTPAHDPELLADMGRRAKLNDEESAVFGQVRSKAPARLVNFR